MELRYYQKAAINAVAEYIANNIGNPCIEIPTGGGKTPIIATLCGELVRDGFRVMVVAHRKELLSQTRDKMADWSPDVRYGLLSAGLKSKEFTGDVLLAGIQSCYRHGTKISSFGNIDFLIIDECHLIPVSSEQTGGMYRTLIDDLKSCNPALTVIGLTATPYRTSSGYVCGEENILSKIVYSVSVNELIVKGFLSPLISKVPKIETDFNKIQVERGEFKESSVEEVFGTTDNIRKAVNEMMMYTQSRLSVLIFCTTVKIAVAVLAEIRRRTKEPSAIVTGSTPPTERDSILRRFKGIPSASDLFGTREDPIKYLVNVDVLTTGFDAANVDTVVLFRPTMSPGLYYQMVGRGFRIAPGKANCLVLDYGGNIQRHGPVDTINPETPTHKSAVPATSKVIVCPRCLSAFKKGAKACPSCGFVLEDKKDYFPCPECEILNPPQSLYCSNCGFKFPIASNNTDHAESSIDILSRSDRTDGGGVTFREEVVETHYWLHKKKNRPDSPFMVWVEYSTVTGTKVSDFLLFGHPPKSWGRERAARWWCRHSKFLPVPADAEKALYHIQAGAVAETTSVIYKPKTASLKYPKLISTEINAKPDYDYHRNPLHIYCPSCKSDDIEVNYFHHVDKSDTQTDSYVAICGECHGFLQWWSDWEFVKKKAQFEKLGIKFKDEEEF